MEGGDDTQQLSLSIAETNKLRASLGLKPLKEAPSQDEQMRKRDEERRKQEDKEERAEAFKAKLAECVAGLALLCAACSRMHAHML